MLTNYIETAMKLIVASKALDCKQLAHVMKLTEEECKSIVKDLEPRTTLTASNINGLIDFFGFSVFNENFSRELISSRSTQYTNWRDVPDALKNMSAACNSFIEATSANGPLTDIATCQDAVAFLQTCESAVELVKESTEVEGDASDSVKEEPLAV